MVELTYHEIARLEEHRQAIGMAETALLAESIAGGSMAYGGVGSWSNQACALGLEGPVDDAELDRLVAFYTSRGVEPLVEVCPFSHVTLISGLARRGFVLREMENVLARGIDATEDLRALLEAWPQGLTMERVDGTDAEQVRAFAEVASSGFRPEGAALEEVELATVSRWVAHPRADALLARIDGVPAGGGGVGTLKAVAALFGTSVLPAFRRRGIQAALIVARLERARGRGATLGIIHSRPGISTERNARRLGFRMAYSRAVLHMPGPGLVPSP